MKRKWLLYFWFGPGLAVIAFGAVVGKGSSSWLLWGGTWALGWFVVAVVLSLIGIGLARLVRG